AVVYCCRDNNFIKDFPQLADGLMVIPLPVEEQCRGVLSEPLPNLQLLTGVCVCVCVSEREGVCLCVCVRGAGQVALVQSRALSGMPGRTQRFWVFSLLAP